MQKNAFFLLLNRERITLLVFFALAVAACIAYFLLFFIPTYESSVRLLIKNTALGSVVTNLGSQEPLESQSGYSNPLFNYQEILKSNMLAQESYTAIAHKFPNTLKQLKIKNRQDWEARFPLLVNTKVVPSTDVIEFTFSWPDKDTAEKVTSTVITAFRSTNLDILRGFSSQQRSYLDEQLEVVSKELTRVREELKDFKLANSAVDLVGETSSLVSKRLELEQRIALARSDLSSYQKEATELSRLLDVAGAGEALAGDSIGGDPFLREQTSRLADLRREEAALKEKFKPTYPALKQLQQQIAVIEKEIKRRRDEVLPSNNAKRGFYTDASSDIITDLARVEARAESKAAELNKLNEELAEMKERETTIPGKQFSLDELTKKEIALAQAYDSIKKKQLDARIEENAIVDNIVLLSEPTPADLNLKKPLINFVGLFAFIMGLGLAFAWIKDGFKDQWNNVEEVEQLTHKPVLASIPWARLSTPGKPRLTQAMLLEDPMVQRSFDGLATGIIHRSYLDNTQVLSLCSLAEERRSSVVASQVAYSLAKAGRQVLLLDADFECPMRHLDYFECAIPHHKGLVEVIGDVNHHLRRTLEEAGKTPTAGNGNGNGYRRIGKETMQQVVGPSIIHIELEHSPTNERVLLDYLTNNDPLNRPSDVIASHGFTTLLAFLKDVYEYILIDTAGVPIRFPEVQAVNNAAQGVLLIAPLQSKREELLQQIDRLENTGHKTFGLILRER